MALFPAFLDTCTLFSSTVNDTLLRLAEQRVFQPLWSADVMTELRSVLQREAGLTEVQARRRADAMQPAFRLLRWPTTSR